MYYAFRITCDLGLLARDNAGEIRVYRICMRETPLPERLRALQRGSVAFVKKKNLRVTFASTLTVAYHVAVN